MLACLTASERAELLKDLTIDECRALEYDWSFWARKNQLLPDGDWITWLVMAGRGFGKTRVGSETVRQWVKDGVRRINIMGKTPADVRDVMIEGDSGILTCCPTWDMPLYEPSKLRLTFPNGAICQIFSGENPDQSRGAQCEKAWIDELAKYRYAQDALDNIMFGLRLGNKPQILITTTPRPTKTIKDLIKDPDTHITRGSTYDNVGNLAESFIKTVIKKYEGTRLGRQELEAEILDDNPNALWRRADIECSRVDVAPDLVRIVVAIDPAVTVTEDSDETGIVIAGKDRRGDGYILGDYTMKGSPEQWARKAVANYYSWRADKIVGEANNGGDMIEFVIRTVDRNVSYKKVHASRGKIVRAEPIAALYEQGRVHHVGTFPELEDELCEWQQGDKSPNRLDALVWAMTELFVKESIDPITVNI